MINVLEQVTIQPCIILIRSFSVDQTKALCKIIYIPEENFIWHPRFFHKTLLSIAGQRIVRVQDSQREICTETYLVSRLHERTKLICFDQSYKDNKNNSCHHTRSDTNCMPPSMREPPLWYLVALSLGTGLLTRKNLYQSIFPCSSFTNAKSYAYQHTFVARTRTRLRTRTRTIGHSLLSVVLHGKTTIVAAP